LIFSIKPQIFELKCVFSYFRLKTHITLLLPVYVHSWEQRKAIDIADYSKGNGYSKGDLADAGTPIILYGRLYTKYQFAISEVDTFAVPRNGAVYSQGNEVIVPASGETAEDIARASAVEKSGVLLGGDLNILRPFDFMNPLFLALAISNGEPQKELAKKAQGKSVVHIHNTDIQEVTIAYPSKTEQDRIVSVFRQLDNLITLHQCKCQIDGCRFQSPLAITWEQRKLGEIGSVSMCRRIFKEQTSENGEIPFYKIGTFGGEADAFISRELFEEYKAKYQYPKKGDILISASGSIGRTVVFTGKNEYFQDSNIVWLNHDKHLDNSFLKCFYSIVKWAGIEGSTIKRLYNDNILNTAITLPSVEEQQKIGAYFENLDNLITLHQCE
jgi:type I restriction enzyme S subunit